MSSLVSCPLNHPDNFCNNPRLPSPNALYHTVISLSSPANKSLLLMPSFTTTCQTVCYLRLMVDHLLFISSIVS